MQATRNDQGQTREEELAQAYRAIDFWLKQGWITPEKANAARKAAEDAAATREP